MTENKQLMVGESVSAQSKAANCLLTTAVSSTGGGDVNGLSERSCNRKQKPLDVVKNGTSSTKPLSQQHKGAQRASKRQDSSMGCTRITSTSGAPKPPPKPIPNKRLTNGAGPSSSSPTGKQHVKTPTTTKPTPTARTTIGSDSEEGFLSTSPDSQNGEILKQNKATVKSAVTKGCTAVSSLSATTKASTSKTVKPACIFNCNGNEKNCVTLRFILESFKSPLSEEHSWALLYQMVTLYRNVAALGERYQFSDLEIPDAVDNVCIHRDGAVHCIWSPAERQEKEQKIAEMERRRQSGTEEHDGDDRSLLIATHKRILTNIAVIIYSALDYNLQADEQCQMSRDLEDLITHMTADENEDDCIDEGIDEGYKRWDDEIDDDKFTETKEFDYVLQICVNHIKPYVPEVHYTAVCHALVTETLELKVFLQQVLNQGADTLKCDTAISKQELAKLGFNDWARFWVQVIDELRRGVRLKKSNYERVRTEYELTPYEILMEDIRSKKYQLRKVMVNGDIPPRVKKDAHALILDFIRSRPPLKKASERKLPPPIKRTPSPREQLMDSIRQGRTLKHITPPNTIRLKDRLLPPGSGTVTASIITSSTSKLQENMADHGTPRTKQRLIKVDFSLLQILQEILIYASTRNYLMHMWR